MKVKPNNYIAIEFPSRSVNEGLARAAVAAFAAQLDPTLDELGDIKTAVFHGDFDGRIAHWIVLLKNILSAFQKIADMRSHCASP